MRLKDRLTLSLTMVTAVVLGISFAAVSLLVHRDETHDLDRAILAQAEAAAYMAVQRDALHLAVTDGQGSIPELPTPTRRYEAIYAANGEVLSATSSFANSVPRLSDLTADESIEEDGVVLNFSVEGKGLRGVIIPIGESGARLLYAVSRRSVDDDMGFLYKVFSSLFVAAVAVTTLVARWLGGRLSRDVDAIARVAREVASGALSARVGPLGRGSSEIAALGVDLDHMIMRLEALMAAQRTFVSHAAHELRSPLAAIRGELQLALRRPRTVEEYRAAIDEVLSEVELLTALTEDLLVLARVQRGATEVPITPMGDAITNALRMARGLASAQGVSLVEPEGVALSAEVRGVKADVARALRNLIDNAIEHSPQGAEVTVSATIKADGDGDGGSVIITVDDRGSGVSAEDAPHIFSPFYRGAKDRSGDTRGTGLGLAIVREIARAYGGDVWLDADHRPGARFVLELRLARAGG